MTNHRAYAGVDAPTRRFENASPPMRAFLEVVAKRLDGNGKLSEAGLEEALRVVSETRVYDEPIVPSARSAELEKAYEVYLSEVGAA